MAVLLEEPISGGDMVTEKRYVAEFVVYGCAWDRKLHVGEAIRGV